MKKVMAMVAGLLLFAALPAGAGGVPPEQLVRETTEKLLHEFKEQREVFVQDRAKLYALADRLVLPHFDFTRMARLVLGKNWRTANDDQRKRFTEEFRNLLVRTYATALFEYTGQKINYKAAKNIDTNEVAVRTEVERGNGAPIPIEYYLYKPDAEWKVFDVSVDGVSLVTNYRASYSATIQNKGLDTLIKEIADKNRQSGQ